MNIFVDKNIIFESSFKFDLKKDINENVCGYKINENGKFSLSFKFKGRDFESMSKIIEDSSIINSYNGKPLLRTSVFIKAIFNTYIIEVSIIENEHIRNFPIQNDSINLVHYDFVKMIVSKWLELTGGV